METRQSLNVWITTQREHHGRGTHSFIARAVREWLEPRSKRVTTNVNEVDTLFEKDPAAAEKKLEAHLTKSPTDVQAYMLLGATRLKLGKSRAAADAFGAALREEASNRPAMVLLATALEAASDLPMALSAWQAVARADPGSKDAQEHVAKLADATGQVDVALDARRELVMLAPRNAETVADLAVALSRANKHSEAVRLFERVTELEPGFFEKNVTEAAAYDESKVKAAQR
jgi:cytochrome c-type biogenesis protein CcmH/NrfG